MEAITKTVSNQNIGTFNESPTDREYKRTFYRKSCPGKNKLTGRNKLFYSDEYLIIIPTVTTIRRECIVDA